MENTLKHVPGLENLPAAARKRLEAIAERVSFKKGEVIFRAGEPSKHAWLLVSGKVALGGTSHDGDQSAVCILREKELFCCLPIMDGGPYTVTAVCETASVAVRVSAKELRAVFSANPGFYEKLVTKFCERIRQTECRICHQSGSAEEKVVQVLRQYRQKYGAEFELTRSDIAQLTGLTVETVIRMMSRLKKKGAIGGTRGVVRILKPEAL